MLDPTWLIFAISEDNTLPLNMTFVEADAICQYVTLSNWWGSLNESGRLVRNGVVVQLRYINRLYQRCRYFCISTSPAALASYMAQQSRPIDLTRVTVRWW